jgi:hypothetical protein
MTAKQKNKHSERMKKVWAAKRAAKTAKIAISDNHAAVKGLLDAAQRGKERMQQIDVEIAALWKEKEAIAQLLPGTVTPPVTEPS